MKPTKPGAPRDKRECVSSDVMTIHLYDDDTDPTTTQTSMSDHRLASDMPIQKIQPQSNEKGCKILRGLPVLLRGVRKCPCRHVRSDKARTIAEICHLFATIPSLLPILHRSSIWNCRKPNKCSLRHPICVGRGIRVSSTLCHLL